jgi:5-methylcytosine-specific restriction endonuclease McrA
MSERVLPRQKSEFWSTKYRKAIFGIMWNHQNGLCAYCLRQMQRDNLKKKDFAVIEHVIPISKGGGEYAPWNVVLACNGCDGKKEDRIWKPKLTTAYEEGLLGHFDAFDLDWD